MPPIHNGGRNMSLDKKLNILLILTSLAYGLLFAILLLGYFFPGNPSPNGLPWFVWASIGVGMAHIVSLFIFFCVIYRTGYEKEKTIR